VKYLLILLLLAGLAGLIYWRLRPYIAMVRRFLGVVREVNRMRPPGAGADLPGREPRATPTGQLVRCAVCGTWVAESGAVKLRGTRTTYCSHSCLERAADGPRRFQRAASR
jgi:hypothetical protein